MSLRRAALFIIALSFGFTVPGGGGVALAQRPDRAIEFEDLGFAAPVEAGARASALRAFAATTADATALVHNNAGLARVKRIHGAVVFAHEDSRTGLDYGTGSTSRDTDAARLAFAGVAFPLPVLQGSLVPAISVHRAFSSELSLGYSRDNVSDGRSENFAMEQSGATWAYSFGAGTDLSSTLSAGVSGFLLNGHIEARRQYDWRPLVTNPAEHTFVIEDIDSDVDGYGAQVGMQIFLHERARIGIRFCTPTVVNLRSSRLREETRQVDNDVGSFLRETTELDTEYIIPYRVDAALAVPVRSVLLTAQVGYCDWSEAAVDGRRVITPQTDTVLRSVVGFGAGIEWSVGRLPLRLRAGFAHEPAALKYLQSDRIDNDRIDPVQAESGRTRVAAGAGLLLRGRILVEAAGVLVDGWRESNILRDDFRATHVSLQGSYWF